MRFMAIIAFCLVAIMALVRDVAPPVVTVQTSSQSPPQPPAQILPEPVLPEIKVSAPEPQPESAKVSIPVTPAAPVPKPVVAAARTGAESIVSRPVKEEPPPTPRAAAVELPAHRLAEAEPKDEPGLSLRFGSDQDFLRLIAKGDVDVFLFDTQDVYRLGKDYAFAQTSAPGELYELMPETIPGAIRAAANSAITNTGDFQWGVVMPERIARRIAALVAVEERGQLVINRYGEVQHLAPPARTTAGG